MNAFKLTDLPVDAALPELAAAFGNGNKAILSAPPGSGKTTRAPLAMLEQTWLKGQSILMLEPRRLAARAAARFMAASLGEPVGERVGYRVRLDKQVSSRTRIEVLTEGILTRRLQQDPELQGVGLVIFDEFHERSLQADLGLALCLDVQQALREDLRLLVMSATLDIASLQTLLGTASLIRAAGQSFAVDTFYDSKANANPVEDAVRGVQRALRERQGDVLAFLPGVGEIRRTQAVLTQRLGAEPVLIRPLFGDLDGRAQDEAIRPDPENRRRVVLATSIAESSLTIEGVSVVVDTGWRRLPRFDPNSGLTRLHTLRVSQASAEQRRGRAGRLGPGTCYRMWPQNQTLDPHGGAEILQADLAPLLLELALWGVDAPHQLPWLDAPPAAALAQARELLQSLDALDANRRITELGRRMAALPVHPRLALMLLRSADAGALSKGADIAALLSERDLFRAAPGQPRSVDLEARLSALQAWRAKSGKGTQANVDASAARHIDQVSRQLRGRVGQGVARPQSSPFSVGGLLALAYPDRLAQRRPASAERYLLSNGRGAFLPVGEALGACEYLAVASLDAGAREGRVFLAARLDESELHSLLASRIVQSERIVWDEGRQLVDARRERRLGALALASQMWPNPPAEQVQAALLLGVRKRGLDCLPWDAKARALQARLACLRAWDEQGEWPDVSDAGLMADLDAWLSPWLSGLSSLKQLKRLSMRELLKQNLDWRQQQTLNELAPETLLTPSGAQRALSYAPGDSPVLAVRLQEMFGQRETPRICRGRIPVTLHLLSPARRPLQITQDLAGFWDRTYSEVRKEMKGRYPKHYWPEDPNQAQATSKVRPRSTE